MLRDERRHVAPDAVEAVRAFLQDGADSPLYGRDPGTAALAARDRRDAGQRSAGRRPPRAAPARRRLSRAARAAAVGRLRGGDVSRLARRARVCT